MNKINLIWICIILLMPLVYSSDNNITQTDKLINYPCNYLSKMMNNDTLVEKVIDKLHFGLKQSRETYEQAWRQKCNYKGTKWYNLSSIPPEATQNSRY